MSGVKKNYVSGEKVFCDINVSSQNKFMRIVRPKHLKLIFSALSLIQMDFNDDSQINGISEKTLMSVHGIYGTGVNKINKVDQKLRLMIPFDNKIRTEREIKYFIKLTVDVLINGKKRRIFKFQQVKLNESIHGRHVEQQIHII